MGALGGGAGEWREVSRRVIFLVACIRAFRWDGNACGRKGMHLVAFIYLDIW